MAWKLGVCVLIYLAAIALSGMLTAALKLPLPATITNGDSGRMLGPLVFGTLILVLGLAPAAARLRGSYAWRFTALALLIYLSLTLNTVIELSIFSTMLKQSGMAGLLVCGILPAAALAAGLSACFRPPAGAPSFPSFSALGWSWRIAAAVLAFPLVYYTFGMMVGPWVVPYDKGGPLGLVIPSPAIILRTELLRSGIFLLASLPVLALWTGSRRGLIGALGLGYAVLVGLYGLSQAGGFFPPLVRILHSLEITADSFAYTRVLAWLFSRPRLPAAIAPELGPSGRRVIGRSGD